MIKSKPTEKPAEKPAEIKRIYKGDIEIINDTFKLVVSKLQKNISFDLKHPAFVSVEHCHFYHTYDSSGSPQKQCNAVGGHTHNIRIYSKDGELRGECSLPIHNKRSEALLYRKKNEDTGKMKVVTNPYNSDPYDKHTHEIQYIKSEKFQARKISPEAYAYSQNLYKPKEGTVEINVESSNRETL